MKRDKVILRKYTRTRDSEPATTLKGILAKSAEYKRQRRIWTILTGPTKPATIVRRREKMATSMRVWQNLQKTLVREAPSRPRLFSSSCHKVSSLEAASSSITPLVNVIYPMMSSRLVFHTMTTSSHESMQKQH